MSNIPLLAIGIDYELFFGKQHGTAERCLIEPTNALTKILDRHGAKLTVFVDAGYLDRLSKSNVASLERTRDTISAQLQSLVAGGHDVQLHIHPHWEDCHWQSDRWQMSTERYRLHDFEQADLNALVSRYKKTLDDLSGTNSIAYRAGGWCLQPFAGIGQALEKAGILVDSTVFSGGVSQDEQRGFDYTKAPDEFWWRFDEDPQIATNEGKFLEIPISSIRVTPWFFIKDQLLKRMDPSAHQALGDGSALTASRKYYIERLTKTSVAPVSIDGAKATLLVAAYKQKARKPGSILNVMGHPKAFTRRSLQLVDEFLERTKVAPRTIRELAEKLAK